MNCLKKIVLLACLAAYALPAMAADLIVEEFGQSPAYATIADAVLAASDGDRIFIKNRSGLIPWIENIIVDKSLEFLPFENDSIFYVEGNYTIEPANGRTVTFIGMDNALGNIVYASAGNTSNRTNVNVLSCRLRSGNISFQTNGYNLTVAGTTLLSGVIDYRYGNLYGNTITSAPSGWGILLGDEGLSPTTKLNIVGNTITAYSGIQIYTLSSFINFSNNFVTAQYLAVQIAYVPTSFSQVNTFYNNTISLDANATFGFYIYIPGGFSSVGAVELMNNLIETQGTAVTAYGIYGANVGLQVNVYYNVIDNQISSVNRVAGTITTQTNNTASAITLNANGTVQGAAGVNAGNPSPLYYDLDLTANDAGAYGGSYTLANYSQMLTGAARVYMVTVPPTVRTGNTLNVTADSYDR